MVSNTTFNNILVILGSVLLVEKTEGPIENHRPVASHQQTLSLRLNSKLKITNVYSILKRAVIARQLIPVKYTETFY
jgi:hypothetical protein